MNGLSTDKQGRHKLQFRLPNGERGGFRLGQPDQSFDRLVRIDSEAFP